VDAHTSMVGPEPYPGNDADLAIRFALSCLQCLDPAPCTANCPQGADVRGVMRWIGQTGCAGFSLARWAAAHEQPPEQQVTEHLFEKYN
jgi:Fe-S-cluster-containing dehydrogenase component